MVMGVLPLKGLLLGGLVYVFFQKFGYRGLLGSLLSIPVLMVGAVVWNQDSILYVPTRTRKYKALPTDVPPLNEYDDITLVCMDRTRISAWFIRQPDHSRRPTIIFFHGNGGTIADRLVNARGLFTATMCNILMVEYRGYGTSEGEPSEDGLMLDAQAALQHLLARGDVDHSNIFLFGRSLGGAVAIWLARRNPGSVRGLIVENTFSSVRAMGIELFPPLRLVPAAVLDALQASRWDNEERVAELEGVPLLLLAGAKDEVVPHQQMMDIWASFRAGAAPEVMRRSRLEKFPGGGHNTTWMIPGYYSRIEQWLALFPGMQSSD